MHEAKLRVKVSDLGPDITIDLKHNEVTVTCLFCSCDIRFTPEEWFEITRALESALAVRESLELGGSLQG